MRIRFVHLKCWPFPKKREAVTIYPFVFMRDKDWSQDIELIKHELEHIKQVEERGWLSFYASYIWEHIKYGYKNNRYEKEARDAEK